MKITEKIRWNILAAINRHLLQEKVILLSYDVASESISLWCIKNDNSLVNKICKLLKFDDVM